MMFSRLKSVTFIELMIAVILLAVIILGINNIDIFSRRHLVSADQRAKVQNDVSRSLEHITKSAGNSIGNETVYGSNTTIYISPDSTNTTTLSFFTDTNGNGLRNPDAGDYWIRYSLNTTSHDLSYCNQCADADCAVCSGTEEVLAQGITAFSVTKDFSQGNYMNVTITGCWDPALTCNTSSNPGMAMSTTLTLPSLSTN
ncbi:MAG: hypothetical protein PHE30_00660 [Candidatus Omnitrophica bacterium]|nr:hypothetical protein [Candidatus Omnitrophota bacterium]MDD5027682.1 hypothetical protein [Candidatus Omnitrophota bacterium]